MYNFSITLCGSSSWTEGRSKVVEFGPEMALTPQEWCYSYPQPPCDELTNDNYQHVLTKNTPFQMEFQEQSAPSITKETIASMISVCSSLIHKALSFVHMLSPTDSSIESTDIGVTKHPSSLRKQALTVFWTAYISLHLDWLKQSKAESVTVYISLLMNIYELHKWSG